MIEDVLKSQHFTDRMPLCHCETTSIDWKNAAN